MKLNKVLVLIAMVVFAWSCNNDDSGDDATTVEIRLLSEVAIEDDAEIKEYLETHFYNYEEFATPSADFDYKIKFDTIAGDNSDKSSLMSMTDRLKIKEITVDSEDLGRSEEEVVIHKLYYLIAREGVGTGSPTIGDNTVLHYEGTYLNGVTFDASNVERSSNLSQFVTGYGNGVTFLKPGIGPFENGDGTVSFDEYGIGAFFIPSGLGYFDRSPQGSSIPAYSPLVFKVDLLLYEANTDSDNDGIPSILEDIDGNGNLNNDNTDSVSEINTFVPNYLDDDDDGDGIPTREEIEDDNGNIITPYPDTDNDGTPDYLDPDVN